MAKSSKASKFIGGRGAKRTAFSTVAAGTYAYRSAVTGTLPHRPTVIEGGQIGHRRDIKHVSSKAVKHSASDTMMVLESVRQTLAQWQRAGRIERATKPVLSSSGPYHDIDVSVWVPQVVWREDRYDDLMDALMKLQRRNVTVSPHVYPYSGERAS